jgi:hypothetical protein
MARFSLKKLNEMESKEKYCVEVSDRFADVKNLDFAADINSAWYTVRMSKLQAARFV